MADGRDQHLRRHGMRPRSFRHTGAVPPWTPRRGGRRLDRIITAFFNEVERRSRCRDRVEQLTAEWSGAIPDGLPDDATV